MDEVDPRFIPLMNARWQQIPCGLFLYVKDVRHISIISYVAYAPSPQCDANRISERDE